MKKLFSSFLCVFFALNSANAAFTVRIKFENVSIPCHTVNGYEIGYQGTFDGTYSSVNWSSRTPMTQDIQNSEWYCIVLPYSTITDLELDIYCVRGDGNKQWLATHTTGITFTNNEVCLIYDGYAVPNWDSFICTPPTPTISGITSGSVCKCDNSAVCKVASPVPGVTYEWTVGGIGWSIFPLTGDSTTLSLLPSASMGGSVSVTASNAYTSITSSSGALTSTVSPPTLGIITYGGNGLPGNEVPVCTAGATLTYDITIISGGGGLTYYWSVPSGWTINSGQNTNSINVTSGTMSGDISVAARTAAGNRCPPVTCAVTGAKPLTPAGPISGSDNVCKNTAGLTYSVPNAPSGLNYEWFVKGAGWSITDGGNTNTVTVTSGTENGLVYLKHTNSCGAGYSDSISLDVNVHFDLSVDFDIPAMGTVGTPFTFETTASDCQGIANLTYYVKLPNQPNFQEISAPASPYTPTQAGAYTFKVVATDGVTTLEEEKQTVVSQPESAITVKVKEYSGWGSNYYIHCWDWTGAFSSFDSNDPPQMTLENICGENWYSYTFPSTLTETDMLFRNRNDCTWPAADQTENINGINRVTESTCYSLASGSNKVEYSVIPCPEPSVGLSVADGIVDEEVCIMATPCPDFFDGSYNITFYVKYENAQDYESLGSNPCFSPAEAGAYSVFVSVEQNGISASAETTINVTAPFTIRIKQPGNEWNEIWIYAHGGTNSNCTNCQIFDVWPGMKLTNPTCDGWYEISLEGISDLGTVIFNDGSNGGIVGTTQFNADAINDIPILTDKAGCYTITNNSSDKLVDCPKKITNAPVTIKVKRPSDWENIVSDPGLHIWRWNDCHNPTQASDYISMENKCYTVNGIDETWYEVTLDGNNISPISFYVALYPDLVGLADYDRIQNINNISGTKCYEVLNTTNNPYNNKDYIEVLCPTTPCGTSEIVSPPVVVKGINIFYNSEIINILSEEIMREVMIFTAQGQVVYTNKVNSTSLSVSKLPQGIYIIKVITASDNYTSKIIVFR